MNNIVENNDKSITFKILCLVDQYNFIDEPNKENKNNYSPIHQNIINNISESILNNDLLKIYYFEMALRKHSK
jgi:hypothetical protein